MPLDIPSAYSRSLEIHSATRLNITLEQYKKTQKFRLALAKFLDQLPDASRNDPEAIRPSRLGDVKVALSGCLL